jgi:hypothetical protein
VPFGHALSVLDVFLNIFGRPWGAARPRVCCFTWFVVLSGAHSRAVPGGMATRVPPLKEGPLLEFASTVHTVLAKCVMEGSWDVVQLGPMWLAC